MSRYIVTGGAGFIGSHLSEFLLKEGHEVIVLDNLLTGTRENVPAGATFIEVDLRNLQDIQPHFSGVDGVFHMAALPRVEASLKDPVETNQHNLDATLNVLLAARDNKVKRVVYSASCSVYGDGHPMPLREDMLPQPMSPYGLQKYVGEHYARIFSLAYGMESVSLRYFNVYGPRMSNVGAYVSVMSVFVRRLKEGQTLTVTGDGEQTRDFTYVTDAVRANWLAMTSTKAGHGEVINIGAGHNHSVNEIAHLFGGEIEYIPARLEPRDALADISRAKELLGWAPEVQVEEGIRRVKESYGLTTATNA